MSKWSYATAKSIRLVNFEQCLYMKYVSELRGVDLKLLDICELSCCWG